MYATSYVCMGVGLCVIHVCDVCVWVYLCMGVCVLHVCVGVYLCMGVCVWVQTQICMS